MKKFTVLFVVVTFLLACNKKTKEAMTDVPLAKKELEEKVEADKNDSDLSDSEESPKKEVYTKLKYKKTACYGRCPVFEVAIKTDGTAIFEGKRFVDKEGTHIGKINAKTLDELRRKVDEIDFFGLYNEYPTDKTQRISDLPIVITTIRRGDMIKEVRNQNGAPDKLYDFQKWIDEMIAEIEWEKKNG